MKKNAAFILLILLIATIPVTAQDYRLIQRGVEYAQMTRGTKDEPVRINLLKLDLKKVRLDVVHAFDSAIGVETTSAMAKRKGALAAINAGFFRLDASAFAGEAAGVLKIDGQLLSESYADRSALGILNSRSKTEVLFGRLNAYGAIGFFQNGTKKFDGINRERKPNEIILYTPAIGKTPTVPVTTTELVFRQCEFGCKRVDVIENRGGTTVPPDGYIVSVGETAKDEYLVEAMKKRAISGLTERTLIFDVMTVAGGTSKLSERFEKAEDIVAGVPRLIRDGKIDITWKEEKSSQSFAETRHPRTAVAKLKNGKLLLVTVDGRQPGYSVGMSLTELAEFLLEIGAVEALNLDGGGSTAMYLDGKVVNKPSDKDGERKVSDAILVFPRKSK
ncbi:MAG: phosphodiester glycosidase family protein [Acidobacteria bacterium]|nr:phosphodiester glycosidase family protein [Acidobacteriota bacterium]MBK8149708.1 phosphodiester glycosidase family protein [Acidobacteriota bacterium]MBK8809833.1 phosphodiester glycosidase family protein [Acidobacteriota bacterium]